jgi:hypothetical protein
MRPQIDQTLDMGQSFLAREFLPDFRLSRVGVFPAPEKEDQ